MTTDSGLRDKLRKVEALFAGAGTRGEKLAAEAALGRIRAKLAELERQNPATEVQFSIADPWSRHLFMALCRRYGLKPTVIPGSAGRPLSCAHRAPSSTRCCGTNSPTSMPTCRVICTR